MLRPSGFALILFLAFAPNTFAADGKRFAVLIGVQKYDDKKFEPLEYTERDVADLAKVLETAGYNVTLLTDSVGQKDKALEPTRANVEKAIKATLGKCTRDDLVLVAFAGHGLRFDGKPDVYVCRKMRSPFPMARTR